MNERHHTEKLGQRSEANISNGLKHGVFTASTEQSSYSGQSYWCQKYRVFIIQRRVGTTSARFYKNVRKVKA